jgi:hypothetical protein
MARVCPRGGGELCYVRVNYEVTIHGIEPVLVGIHSLGGPAPVLPFPPDLVRLSGTTLD